MPNKPETRIRRRTFLSILLAGASCRAKVLNNNLLFYPPVMYQKKNMLRDDCISFPVIAKLLSRKHQIVNWPGSRIPVYRIYGFFRKSVPGSPAGYDLTDHKPVFAIDKRPCNDRTRGSSYN